MRKTSRTSEIAAAMMDLRNINKTVIMAAGAIGSPIAQ